MPTHLSDTRDVKTMAAAKLLLQQLRDLTCQREIIVAKAEKKISDLTTKAEHDAEPIDKDIFKLEKKLTAFITGNQHLFKSPKSIKTSDGKFGLRGSSRLVVTNKDKAIEFVVDNEYDECFKITRSLVSPAIKNKITEEKEKVPGCKVESGEIAYYTIDKALVARAVEGV